MSLKWDFANVLHSKMCATGVLWTSKLIQDLKIEGKTHLKIKLNNLNLTYSPWDLCKMVGILLNKRYKTSPSPKLKMGQKFIVQK